LLFADIVQSTDMADVTEPEIVQDVLVLHRRVATATIEELGGRVLQFQGDGVVACFGYPVAHEDDARRAVLAALRLVERMGHAGMELRGRHGIENLDRTFAELPNVPFRDHVWPLFLRDNAMRIFKLGERR
jgi:class 3 adenylate cyclase